MSLMSSETAPSVPVGTPEAFLGRELPDLVLEVLEGAVGDRQEVERDRIDGRRDHDGEDQGCLGQLELRQSGGAHDVQLAVHRQLVVNEQHGAERGDRQNDTQERGQQEHHEG